MSVGLQIVRLLYGLYVFGHLSKWFTFLFLVPVSLSGCVVLTLAANGLQLPEGGDCEAPHCQSGTNFDRSTKLDLTTEPPLLGRCCYGQLSSIF